MNDDDAVLDARDTSPQERGGGQVGGEAAEVGAQAGDDAGPQVGGVGVAVEQQHGRAAAAIDQAHAGAVDKEEAVITRRQGLASMLGPPARGSLGRVGQTALLGNAAL